MGESWDDGGERGAGGTVPGVYHRDCGYGVLPGGEAGEGEGKENGRRRHTT